MTEFKGKIDLSLMTNDELIAAILHLNGHRAVKDGIAAMEQLVAFYDQLKRQGGELTEIRQLLGSNVIFDDKDIKHTLYFLIKEWERGKNHELSQPVRLSTVIIWHKKGTDISDIKSGTYEPKKWWEFWK